MATCKAPDPLLMVEDIKLGDLRKPSKSLSRVALVEQWSAPRLKRDSRYVATGQCMRFMRQLNSHARQNEQDIQAELAEAVPDEALIKIMTVQSLAPRIQSFQCPVCMIPLSYTNVTAFCLERSKAFSIVSKYEASDEEGRARLRQQFF